MRRLFAALAFLAGFIPAVAGAQSPPAVPALPDATRLTTYSVSASTCICSVGFAIYGDGTDVDEWIEVWLAGTRRLSTDPTYGWSLSSATGALATIPRPITDAVLTFTLPQTGTVQIIGARRPRRTSQFNENRGVAARDLNQVITDQVATQRETWDLKSRMFLAAPGSLGGTVSGIFTAAVLNGTSTTSITIGTGSKTFTTQSGLAFAAGVRLRVSATSDLTQWMEGIATAYSGTSLTISVDTTNGAGTFASWAFNIAGIPFAGGSLSLPLLTTPSTAPASGLNLGVGVAPSSPANGDVWVTSTGLFARANGATAGPLIGATISGAIPPLTINPTANSIVQGLMVNQTGIGGANGGVIGPHGIGFAYNQIDIESDTYNSTAPSPYTIGSLVTLVTGGAASHGTKMAFEAYVIRGSAANGDGDTIAGSFLAQSLTGDGGTNTGAGAKGTIFALAPVATVGAAATNMFEVSGAEFDVGILTGGSARYRFGISLVNNGNLPAADTTYDAALEISSTGDAAGGWRKGILFSNLHGGVSPILTTGCAICTDGSANTITTGMDLSAYTISGNFLKGPSFTVTGAGAVSAATYSVGATAGVDCTGVTAGTVTVAKGIVTHC